MFTSADVDAISKIKLLCNYNVIVITQRFIWKFNFRSHSCFRPFSFRLVLQYLVNKILYRSRYTTPWNYNLMCIEERLKNCWQISSINIFPLHLKSTMSSNTTMAKVPNSFLYFAYGSNLLKKRIRINNPSAEFLGIGKLEVSSTPSSILPYWIINRFSIIVAPSHELIIRWASK